MLCRRPANASDPETLILLASIGVEKGKAFAPDARMKAILTEAAAVANADDAVESLSALLDRAIKSRCLNLCKMRAYKCSHYIISTRFHEFPLFL